MSYVDWIFDGLNYDQKKPLYIDATNPERHLSAIQAKSLVSRIAGGLRDNGLEKGGCVCVMSFNDIYYTPLYLGIMAAGGIFTGANPGYTVYEMAHHLRICNAKFLVSGLSSLDTAKKAAAEVGIPESNIIIFNVHHEEVPSMAKTFWNLTEGKEIEWEPVTDPVNTPACYINSSGTSGLPKAVVVPHAYMIAQCKIQTDRRLPYQVRRLICLPPFPGYVAPSQHGAPLKAGNICYVMPRYSPKSFIDAVEKYQITETLLVPPMLLSLPLSAECTRQTFGSLRQVFCGGAPVGNHVQQALYKLLHTDARINQIYGMTECGWICGFQYPENDDTGSVGRPLKDFSVKLVDDSGKDITESGKTGEVYIKAPFPMVGYLNNPAATAEANAPGGWIKSGDIGYFRSGRWYVCDRKKDIIKVRGWQVSPTELEAVLLLHPDITDAAVIGVKCSEGLTELPHAYVVRAAGSTITEAEVKEWMRARLARYKDVEEVIFVPTLPRNPTGKILRRFLREAEVKEEKPVAEKASTKNLAANDGIAPAHAATAEILRLISQAKPLKRSAEEDESASCRTSNNQKTSRMGLLITSPGNVKASRN